MAQAVEISPPGWLGRAEKSEFRRVSAARKGLGRPVTPAEVDALSDYVAARSRLRVLTKRAAALTDYETDSLLKLHRQLDATTSLSRRLARDLGLVGGGQP